MTPIFVAVGDMRALRQTRLRMHVLTANTLATGRHIQEDGIFGTRTLPHSGQEGHRKNECVNERPFSSGAARRRGIAQKCAICDQCGADGEEEGGKGRRTKRSPRSLSFQFIRYVPYDKSICSLREAFIETLKSPRASLDDISGLEPLLIPR